jgi:K+-transporting ATPase ATPase C chain
MSSVRELLVSARVALFFLVVCGLAYPLVVTGATQALFPRQARGSLVLDEKGAAVGSELIGQRFAKAAYLQPRPSAAGDKGYDPKASGGSNLGHTAQKLRDRVAADRRRLLDENSAQREREVPVELLTASASGLDPHLSPEAALWQVPRIAAARHVAEERVRAIIAAHVEGRELGFLGEPRVNVLLVNLALDRQLGRPE